MSIRSMAFNFAKLCSKGQFRNHLKLLSVGSISTEHILGRQFLFARQICSVVPNNLHCNNFHKTSPGIFNESFSKQLHCCLQNISSYSTGIKAYSVNTIIPDSLKYNSQLLRYYSSAVQNSSSDNSSKELTKAEKLKRAVKEYGATVIIFHVTISLISLGCCYLAVASGLNLGSILNTIGLEGSCDISTEAGLFVVAYAIHKVLAPVRISITLAATPFIVRYLRKINVLKPPKRKQPKRKQP